MNNDEMLFHDSLQLIVVNAENWDSCKATMQWFERPSAKDGWEPVNQGFDVAIGKHGLAYTQNLLPIPDGNWIHKKEGDLRAPAGLFRFCFAFGYAQIPDKEIKWPYLSLTENFVGVDDPESRYYNCIVDQSKLKTPDWKSAETMRRPDGLYKWGMVVDFNFSPCVPGAGSQIYLHIWRGSEIGTEGCTAMPENKMLELLQWIEGEKSPLFWQGVGVGKNL